MNTISLVIPAYNEEKRIETTVREYYAYLKHNFSNFELIVVCNNCTDRTPKIVRDLSRELKKTKYLNFPYYTGKGGAVIAGFKEARFELIGFVDADNATTPREFDKLVKNINGYDCVIASRAAEGSYLVKKQPFTRRALGKIYSYITQCLFLWNIKDTQCGAKLFKKQAIKEILPSLKIIGFAFDVEMLWELKKRNKKFREVGIRWKDYKGSKVGIFAPVKMFIQLLKIRFF